MSKWSLSQIPKIAHFYWGNKQMPFMRYLSLYSFSKLNPDWEIKLHVPTLRKEHLDVTWKTHEHRGGDHSIFEFTDYTNRVSELDNLSVIEHDFVDKNCLNEVFKSDILRWMLLGTCGGV